MNTTILRYGVILLVLAAFCLTPGGAQAKWWIFGQANDEVSFGYLYLNQISYDECGPKVSVPKNSLGGGRLLISGKVAVGKGKVGGVRVTTDNKETWQEGKLADDGVFEYSFTPEVGKSYILFIEATDTTGKTNDVEKTRKELTVIDSNVQQLVRKALEDMVAAYRAEDPASFMKTVSPEFTGDAVNLDRAVRKDFSAFDNIDLRFTLNNVTLDPKGKVFASLTFSRSVTSSRNGKSYSDSGSTQFIFSIEELRALVYTMKNPLIFGLSDPEDVAQGSATTGNSQPLIIVDPLGNVAKVPADIYFKLVADGSFTITTNPDGTSTIKTADKNYIVTPGGAVTISSNSQSGAFTLIFGNRPEDEGFDFAGGSNSIPTLADIFIEFNAMFPKFGAGTTFKDLGVTGIDTVTQAPVSGYQPPLGFMFLAGANIGHTFAFRLSTGKYALLEVINWTDLGYPHSRSTYKFKYQPDGSRNF